MQTQRCSVQILDLDSRLIFKNKRMVLRDKNAFLIFVGCVAKYALRILLNARIWGGAARKDINRIPCCSLLGSLLHFRF